MEPIVQEILSGKRFALLGFDPAEANPIIEALHDENSFGHAINAVSNIPGLNSSSPFDACFINASAQPVNGNAAPIDSISRSQKPALVIGTADELRRQVAVFAEPTRDFVVRPYQPEEIVLRAFRILRFSKNAATIASPTYRGAGRRLVLIADDDAATVVLISAILKHSRFECEVARDGIQALALAREKKPDLMLLDVSMPKMDGFDALTALRTDPSTRTLPVVLMTSHHAEEEVVRGFSLGADDYVTKPFNSGELMARINHILRITQGN